MKQLLKKFLLYAAIVTAIYWGYLTAMSAILNRDNLYKVDAQKTVLLMGDSHIAYGIIDSNMEHVINLSQPADMYLYNYLKLQKLLPQNPQIRTVVIGCAGHNIQQFWSDVFLTKQGFTQAKVQNYYHLLSTTDMSYLLYHSPEQVIKGVVGLPKLKTPYLLKILRHQPVTLEQLKIGGYAFHDDKLDLDKNRADVDKLNKKGTDQLALWTWHINYLHKIVDLCKSRGVNVVFVRTPEHKLFPKPIEPEFQKFLKREFPDVPFADFMKMDLPDSCFADLDHLNYYGAKVFSDSFAHYAATLR
jgi:hypothetical protein